MTAHAGPAPAAALPEAAAGSGLRWWLNDCRLVAQRNMRRIVRAPDMLINGAVLPLMFFFLFRFVFGGAMQMSGDQYTQFLLPGMFVMMIMFGSMPAMAIGMAEDARVGLMNRFRSLPMTRSALLFGRALSEAVRNLIGMTSLLLVGTVTGFRFSGGLLSALAALGLLLLFGFALALVAGFIGLTSSSVTAAQTSSTVWFGPVGFISSVYVPTETLPTWLRVIAEVNPVTFTIDAVRSLAAGQDPGTDAWLALAWALGLVAVFAPLAVHRLVRRG